MGNKSDVGGGMTQQNIADALGLQSFDGILHMTFVSGLTGEGVEEAFQWLVDATSARRDE